MDDFLHPPPPPHPTASKSAACITIFHIWESALTTALDDVNVISSLL